MKSRWLETPAHVTEREGDLPAGFRMAGVACGLKPSGGLDLGLLVAPAGHGQRRAVHALRRAGRAGRALPDPHAARRDPGRGRQLRQRQRGHRAARLRGGGAHAGRRGDGRRRARGPGGGRLHRRDRRAARRGRRDPRASPGRAAELREHGQGDFSEAIQTTDKFAKEVEVDVALPSGTVRLTAQAKGAGMISPNFATMLCFVQTDAAMPAETARPAARRVRRALVRPHLRRRPALHQRHGDRCRPRARAACGSSPTVRRRAALRRGAGLGAAPARAGDRARRRGRAPGRPGGRPGRDRRARRGRRPGGGELAAGQGGAARRRPELGPDRPGGRRRDDRHVAAGHRHLHRGRPGVLGRAGGAPRRRRRWPPRSPATRSSTRSCCPATARRPSCSSPTSRTTT